jgi:hypothetical protein
MVTFVSLFLWLMTNAHPVEVAVEGPAVSAEIFLDGVSIGVARPPRWRVICDFGQDLRPHELVAVARDENGAEVGRATQFVNLPRPDAEVELVLEDGPSGVPETVSTITASSERLYPLAVVVTFDGRLLVAEKGGRFRLPAYDPKEIHILSAEAHFPDGVSARKDVTFGGSWGSRVATELTAVPIIFEKGRRPTPADLEGALRVRGEAVKVAAIERPGGRVYLIRDHGSFSAMGRIGRLMGQRAWPQGGQVATEPNLPPKKERFHLVVPNATERRGLALFPIIEAIDLKYWGLPWLATTIRSNMERVLGQKLAEAAAVAGVRAAGDGCPRVVVLALSEEAVDDSRYASDAVRKYLHALRVPLVVWSVDGTEAHGGWGPAVDVSTPNNLERASRRLMKSMRRQWIVWVEGRHLVSDIELDASLRGVRLAG